MREQVYLEILQLIVQALTDMIKVVLSENLQVIILRLKMLQSIAHHILEALVKVHPVA